MRRDDFFVALGRIFSDGICIFAGLMVAYFLRMEWYEAFGLAFPATLYPFASFLVFAAQVTAFLLGVFMFSGRYRLGGDEKALEEIPRIFWDFSAGMALLLVYFYFIQFTFFSRFIFAVAWGVSLVLLVLGRATVRIIRAKLARYGIGRRRIVLLGTGQIAPDAIRSLEESPFYEIIGILTEKKSTQKTFQKLPILGSFKQLEAIIKAHRPDEVLMVADESSQKITHELVRTAHIYDVRFRLLPDELGLDMAAVDISTLHDLPTLTLLSTRLQGWSVFTKRLFDLAASSVALVGLSPLLGFLALRVYLDCPEGEILYRSKRVGKNGKEFWCLKFRSMVPDAEAQKKKLLTKNQRKGGVFFKIEDDPRITPFGQVLRRWSLDELPQLLNVLRGEMSLIGPRPHLPEEVAQYPKDDLRVLAIRPGISGFAQIHGRSGLSFEEEMKYEMFYVKNWSLRLDMVIIIKSIVLVLAGRNAH